MITASKIDQRPQVRRRIDKLKLPLNRPSILDPSLDSDPWIDYCPRANKLILFLQNHPIAIIAGSSLDFFALSMRLNQLRHRWPRQ